MAKFKASTSELRHFGLLLALAVTVWGGIYQFLSSSKFTHLWPLYSLAFILAYCALFKPSFLRQIHAGWTWLTEIINKIISHTLMSILFILVVTPSAFVLRLMGHNALSQQNTFVDSYRIKSKAIEKNNMEQPY
jgi:hypothetical protein